MASYVQDEFNRQSREISDLKRDLADMRHSHKYEIDELSRVVSALKLQIGKFLRERY